MQIWKFVLMGISGNLAKTKILPALAQFAETNEESVQVELIGYSRSPQNISSLNSYLDSLSNNGKHSFKNITHIEGNYDDIELISSLLSSQHEDERLVFYLALPPNVFIPFLEKACIYDKRSVDIIVEKPFGEDLKQAKSLIKTIKDCNLTNNIHFFDHYLFKSSSFINKAELSNFKEIKQRTLQKISIKAVEEVGVETRLDYYAQTGAFKDMWQHIYSLLQITFDYFSFELSEKTKLYSTFWDDIVYTYAQKGVYESFQDVSNENTDTYFKIIGSSQSAHIDFVFESGKRLGKKVTVINLEFEGGYTIEWNIDPTRTVSMHINGQPIIAINLSKNTKLDHTNLFEYLLDPVSSRFVQPDEVIFAWQKYNQITKLAEFRTHPKKYVDGFYPPQFI